MRPRAGAATALAAAVTMVVPSACAGPARAQVALVSITDRGFSEPTLVVPVGTEVRWVNDGARSHTVTTSEQDGEPAVPAGATAWDSGPLRSGETFSRRFDVEGTYGYWCQFHRHEQMLGSVEVVDR